MSKYFKITTDKPPLSYKCGEKIEISVRAFAKCHGTTCDYFKWKMETDDGKKSEGLANLNDGKPYLLETSLSRPGFVHINCVAFTKDNQPDSSFDVFDGGVGVEPEKITFHGTLPEDYSEYWNNIKKTVDDFRSEITYIKQITENVPDEYECYDIKLTAPLGNRVSGIYTIPKREGKYPIKVAFHGYGLSNSFPIYEKDTIVFDINAHGIDNLTPNIISYDLHKDLNGYGFNKKENERPETTYWQGMIIRDLTGLKYIKTLPEWDGENLVMFGGSQGAFQSVHMASLDDDVSFLNISIPWFCDLDAENNGYLHGWRPEAQNGLRYFDTVAAGMQIKCPVKIVAFLGDYVCPPTTVTALYNSIKTQKSLDFIQGGTHGYRPPEIEEYHYRHNPLNPTDKIEKGVYKHFKGNKYEVLGTALNSETLEDEIIYKELYGDGKIWARPRYMWDEVILKNNKVYKRFTKEK